MGKNPETLPQAKDKAQQREQQSERNGTPRRVLRCTASRVCSPPYYYLTMGPLNPPLAPASPLTQTVSSLPSAVTGPLGDKHT